MSNRAVLRAEVDELRSLTELHALLERTGAAQPIRLSVAGESVVLPSSAKQVLRIALEEFAAGHVVAIEPLHDEVSTQEAADLLRVSRPYVVKLIENGEIPCRKVGPRRRLRLEDVLEYREARDMRRHTALRDLSRLSQELGLD